MTTNIRQVLDGFDDDQAAGQLLPHIDDPISMRMVVSSGRVALIARLFQGGLQVDLRDRHGVTLLDRAAGAGQASVVRQLLDYGASLAGLPLVSAAYAGSLDCVKLLVEAGADVDAGLKGFPTPLSTAIAFKHHDIEAYLRAHGATKLVGEGAPE